MVPLLGMYPWGKVVERRGKTTFSQYLYKRGVKTPRNKKPIYNRKKE